MQLKAQKFSQEEELKVKVKELAVGFNPVTMLKESLHNIASDREVQFDLAKVGLNTGATFLIDKVLGRNNSIKGFLSSLLVGNLSSSLIENYAPQIISGISKLLSKKTEQ